MTASRASSRLLNVPRNLLLACAKNRLLFVAKMARSTLPTSQVTGAVARTLKLFCAELMVYINIYEGCFVRLGCCLALCKDDCLHFLRLKLVFYSAHIQYYHFRVILP